MMSFGQLWSEAADSYREMMREAKKIESIPPKKYGELLQKKRKRGKRK